MFCETLSYFISEKYIELLIINMFWIIMDKTAVKMMNNLMICVYWYYKIKYKQIIYLTIFIS